MKFEYEHEEKDEAWFGLTIAVFGIILLITFLLSFFIFSKNELDVKVKEKVEELKKQNSPHMIVIEPVSNEEMDLFLKQNGLEKGESQ